MFVILLYIFTFYHVYCDKSETKVNEGTIRFVVCCQLLLIGVNLYVQLMPHSILQNKMNCIKWKLETVFSYSLDTL